MASGRLWWTDLRSLVVLWCSVYLTGGIRLTLWRFMFERNWLRALKAKWVSEGVREWG